MEGLTSAVGFFVEQIRRLLIRRELRNLCSVDRKSGMESHVGRLPSQARTTARFTRSLVELPSLAARVDAVGPCMTLRA